MPNPYKTCPTYETKNFTLRLVSEDDAHNLLVCYSDPRAGELFNTDNFPHDSRFNTTEEMREYIKFWLMEYSQEAYIRFAIVDKSINKAVGTIEMFGMIGRYKTEIGILRLDIASKYEEKAFLKELLDICVQNFYNLFEVDTIATKAINQASDRIDVLKSIGFQAKDFNGRSQYYLRTRKESTS